MSSFETCLSLSQQKSQLVRCQVFRVWTSRRTEGCFDLFYVMLEVILMTRLFYLFLLISLQRLNFLGVKLVIKIPSDFFVWWNQDFYVLVSYIPRLSSREWFRYTDYFFELWIFHCTIDIRWLHFLISRIRYSPEQVYIP